MIREFKKMTLDEAIMIVKIYLKDRQTVKIKKQGAKFTVETEREDEKSI